MSIIDKANEYIGHPREVDEGYEVSMRRTAYAQGYQDAIDKVCDWIQCMALDYITGDITDVKWESMFADLRKYVENGDN